MIWVQTVYKGYQQTSEGLNWQCYPDKQNQISVKLQLFSYLSISLNICCRAKKNCLIDTFLFSTHNISIV